MSGNEDITIALYCNPQGEQAWVYAQEVITPDVLAGRILEPTPPAPPQNGGTSGDAPVDDDPKTIPDEVSIAYYCAVDGKRLYQETITDQIKKDRKFKKARKLKAKKPKKNKRMDEACSPQPTCFDCYLPGGIAGCCNCPD